MVLFFSPRYKDFFQNLKKLPPWSMGLVLFSFHIPCDLSFFLRYKYLFQDSYCLNPWTQWSNDLPLGFLTCTVQATGVNFYIKWQVKELPVPVFFYHVTFFSTISLIHLIFLKCNN